MQFEPHSSVTHPFFRASVIPDKMRNLIYSCSVHTDQLDFEGYHSTLAFVAKIISSDIGRNFSNVVTSHSTIFN